MSDNVNHPKHYVSHPSGVECIQITEHMDFLLGNAMKYLWRAGVKSESPVEDLEKARWYLDRKLDLLSREKATESQHDPLQEAIAEIVTKYPGFEIGEAL